MSKKKICCICKKSFAGHGNNPFPAYVNGVCCESCNYSVVIPLRMTIAKEHNTKHKEV